MGAPPHALHGRQALKIAIIGVGAIGGYLGTRLAHAGDEERSVTIEEFDYLVDFFRVVAFEIDLAVKETIEQGFE